MARIGGKGMIVKNCPAIISLYERPQCALPSNYYCKDCTDCVIKQVIEKCKKKSGKCERCKASEDYQPTDCLNYCSYDDVIFATEILQLFDIEEVNK